MNHLFVVFSFQFFIYNNGVFLFHEVNIINFSKTKSLFLFGVLYNAWTLGINIHNFTPRVQTFETKHYKYCICIDNYKKIRKIRKKIEFMEIQYGQIVKDIPRFFSILNILNEMYSNITSALNVGCLHYKIIRNCSRFLSTS